MMPMVAYCFSVKSKVISTNGQRIQPPAKRPSTLLPCPRPSQRAPMLGVRTNSVSRMPEQPLQHSHAVDQADRPSPAPIKGTIIIVPNVLRSHGFLRQHIKRPRRAGQAKGTSATISAVSFHCVANSIGSVHQTGKRISDNTIAGRKTAVLVRCRKASSLTHQGCCERAGDRRQQFDRRLTYPPRPAILLLLERHRSPAAVPAAKLRQAETQTASRTVNWAR